MDRPREAAYRRDLLVARSLVEGGCSVALVRDGRPLARRTGDGIAPLLEACAEAGDVAGAALADKTVGVAVAKLSVFLRPARSSGSRGPPPA
ncbi:MAG: DUF1893 domain-containing protein, partial [Firmicutes bacterium]|nr:DUF1893 domain-containing protein [Bacillota bacterium]